MDMTNHSTDIVGYTYKAENYRPEDLIERLIRDGLATPAARDMAVEDVLDQIAGANAIDRQDEYSFDTDDFPKVIFRDQWEDTQEDDDPFEDEDESLPLYTVLGLFKVPGMMDTIVQFVCEAENGNRVIVAADHRPARDIIEALCDGSEDVQVRPEGWAVAPCPVDAQVFVPTTM